MLFRWFQKSYNDSTICLPWNVAFDYSRKLTFDHLRKYIWNYRRNRRIILKMFDLYRIPINEALWSIKVTCMRVKNVKQLQTRWKIKGKSNWTRVCTCVWCIVRKEYENISIRCAISSTTFHSQQLREATVQNRDELCCWFVVDVVQISYTSLYKFRTFRCTNTLKK